MRKWLWSAVIVSALILSACGNGGEKTPQATPAPGSGQDGGGTKTPDKVVEVKKKDPYTLKLYAAGVSEEEFDSRFRAVLESKFPHITFNYRRNVAGATITELVAQNDIPDLIRTDIPTLKNLYMDLGLAYDLRDLIKQNNYDMNRFNHVFTQEITDVVRTGEVYGLPVPPYFPQVLYYNKDLFNKFGQDYPTDGMSFDEVYDLARLMTRNEGSENFRGFSANITAWLRDNPYSHPILDPKIDGLSETSVWQTMFTTLKRFYEIPGNKVEKTVGEENNIFSKGSVAMQLNQHNIYLIIPEEVDWDIVSTPTIPGGPQLMGQRGPAYWSISKQSEHKEEAFEVIMTMISDEIALEDSRQGIPTVLVNKEIQDALGSEHPIYSSKNMAAINYYLPAPPTPKREPGLVDIAGGTQQNSMGPAFHKMVLDASDMNTALRDLNEVLKMHVEEERSKQK